MDQMDFSSEQQHQQQQQQQQQQHQQHQQQLLDEVTHELISAISFVKTRSPEYNYVSTRQIVAPEKSVALFSLHNPYYSGTPLLITDFKLYWSSDIHDIKCEYVSDYTMQQQFSFCELDRILGCKYRYALHFSKETGFYDTGIYVCHISIYNSTNSTNSTNTEICKITFESSDKWLTILQNTHTHHDFANAIGMYTNMPSCNTVLDSQADQSSQTCTSPEINFTIDMISVLAKTNMRALTLDHDAYKALILGNIWQYLIKPTTLYFSNVIDHFDS